MNEFEKKRNALFACLDDASSELKGTSLEQNKLKTHAALEQNKNSTATTMIYRHGGNKQVSQSSALKHLRGKESIFKKPELPIGRCLKPRRAPDYKLNPHKWKKYSLEDVDISDQQNASAAFAFLRQIEEQKEASADSDLASADSNKKIEFKKSSQIKRRLKAVEFMELADVEVDSAKLRGSKVVMPEYVVGQARKPSAKKKQHNSLQENARAAGTLSLSHLQEADDDDDDEDV